MTRGREAAAIMPVEAGTAVVVLRDTGQVLNDVTVLEPAFRIKTPDLGTVTIPTSRVKTIIYRNLTTYPTDMLRTFNGTEYNGDVLNEPVRVRTADLGETALAKSLLLSIIW